MTVSLNERLQAKIEQDKQALNVHRAELEKASKAQMQKLSTDLQKHAVNSASACENALKVTVSAIEKLKAETIQGAEKALNDHLASLGSQLDSYDETIRHQLKGAGVWTLAALTVSALIVLSGFGLGWMAFNWQLFEMESMTAEKSALVDRITALKGEHAAQITANAQELAELSGIGLQVIKNQSGFFLSRRDGKDIQVKTGFTIKNSTTGQSQKVVEVRN